MTQKYLDQALVGKTIKSAENKEDEIVIIRFTDGSYLEILADDNDELSLQLIQPTEDAKSNNMMPLTVEDVERIVDKAFESFVWKKRNSDIPL